MNFTKELVDDFALKLLIGLREEENQMVLDEFEEIEHHMDLICQIPNISSVEPMTHPPVLFDETLREDDFVEEMPVEDVLCNAAHKNLSSVIVPKVVKE